MKKTFPILSALLILCAAGFFGIRALSAEPEAVKDFEIRYAVGPFCGGGTGEIRLYYAAPDSWRLETHTGPCQETLIVQGDRMLFYDASARAWLLTARDNFACLSFGLQALNTDLSQRYRSWADYTNQRSYYKTGTPTAFLSRPGYEKTSNWDPTAEDYDADTLGWRRIGDKQLLIPLLSETKEDDKIIESMKATLVKINSGLAPELFNADLPATGPVFKGALSEFPDLPTGEPANPVEKLKAAAAKPGATPYFIPTYLPAGFFLCRNEHNSDGDLSWGGIELAAASGATIVIVELTENNYEPLEPLSGSKATTVGKYPGKIAERSEPYRRVGLFWTQERQQFFIDAAEVPAAEVLKIAESMTRQGPKATATSPAPVKPKPVEPAAGF